MVDTKTSTIRNTYRATTKTTNRRGGQNVNNQTTDDIIHIDTESDQNSKTICASGNIKRVGVQ